MAEEEKIIEKLKEIIDPELGIDIVTLGLIKEIKIDGKDVYVKFRPTSPFCPLMFLLKKEIEEKIKELGYNPKVEIDLSIDI